MNYFLNNWQFFIIIKNEYTKYKVWLQNWLYPKTINFLNKINITIYFENLTVKLYVLYTFITHVKFYVNRILFTM